MTRQSISDAPSKPPSPFPCRGEGRPERYADRLIWDIAYVESSCTPLFVNGQSLSMTNDWGRVKRAGLTEAGAVEIEEVG